MAEWHDEDHPRDEDMLQMFMTLMKMKREEPLLLDETDKRKEK